MVTLRMALAARYPTLAPTRHRGGLAVAGSHKIDRRFVFGSYICTIGRKYLDVKPFANIHVAAGEVYSTLFPPRAGKG